MTAQNPLFPDDFDVDTGHFCSIYSIREKSFDQRLLWYMSKKEGTVQFRMNICGPDSGCNGLQVILIQTHSVYENQLVQSYGN